MKNFLCLMFLSGACASLAAQTSAAGGSWDRLKHVPAGTNVHVAADKQRKTCRIDTVDEATLRCSNGHGQYSFARDEVKSVKLTRYGRSTLVGAAIGVGAGAGIGAIAGHAEDPPNDFFHGLTTDAFTAIGGAAGLIVGAAVGGPTDFLRGPLIYRR
jgi:hypothetical protein